MRKRWYGVAALAIGGVMLGGGLFGAQTFSADQSGGRIDDGADLLPQAAISVDQAIRSAQSSVSGAVGEVDLEYFSGHLVFNVDVGDLDVKVDAQDGTVLTTVRDD